MTNKYAYAIGQEVLYKGEIRKIADYNSYHSDDAFPDHRNPDWNVYWFEGWDESEFGSTDFLVWQWELIQENGNGS